MQKGRPHCGSQITTVWDLWDVPISVVCCSACALCNWLVTLYLCVYPARARANGCGLSSSHCTLLRLSGCRAAACSPFAFSPSFSPFQAWERSSVSMGEGDTKIAVQINPLHSQLQHGFKCHIFSSKKAFFSPNSWWLRIHQPLKGLAVGFLNKAGQFCNP